MKKHLPDCKTRIPETWTIRDVCRYTRRSERTIRRWVARRIIPVHRLPSGGLLFKADEVRDVVEGDRRW